MNFVCAGWKPPHWLPGARVGIVYDGCADAMLPAPTSTFSTRRGFRAAQFTASAVSQVDIADSADWKSTSRHGCAIA
jgi:hypothetical protein